MAATLAAISIGTQILGIGLGLAGNAESNSQARKAAKAQYEQALDIWEYDWESAKRKWNYAKSTVDLQRQNSDAVWAYQTELAAQSWDQQMQQREYEYVNAVKAFNRSEEQFEDQIAINNWSLDIAKTEATQSFNEAAMSIAFQGEDMRRDLTKTLTDASFAKAEIERQKYDAIGTASNQRRRNELEYQLKSIDSSFKSQEAAIETLLAEGQLRGRGQSGRSTGKAVQSILALGGRKQAAIAQNMATAEKQYDIQAHSIDHTMINAIHASNLSMAKTDSDLDFARQNYNQGLRELNASISSARNAWSSNMMKINRDKAAADMNAHYSRMIEPSLGPEIPKPLEIPKSIFIDPLKPLKPPKPEEMAPQTIPALTSFGQAAQGLGNVAMQAAGAVHSGIL